MQTLYKCPHSASCWWVTAGASVPWVNVWRGWLSCVGCVCSKSSTTKALRAVGAVSDSAEQQGCGGVNRWELQAVLEEDFSLAHMFRACWAALSLAYARLTGVTRLLERDWESSRRVHSLPRVLIKFNSWGRAALWTLPTAVGLVIEGGDHPEAVW